MSVEWQVLNIFNPLMVYKSSITESLPVACTTFLNAYFYVFGLLKLREITKDKKHCH